MKRKEIEKEIIEGFESLKPKLMDSVNNNIHKSGELSIGFCSPRNIYCVDIATFDYSQNRFTKLAYRWQYKNGVRYRYIKL